MKMHDEEIIKEATKAVEKNWGAGCYVGDLLNIINRQKAEIERLQKTVEQKANLIEKKSFAYGRISQKHAAELKTAKAEAVKGCIEKVKEKANKSNWVSSGVILRTEYTIGENSLDNLLKELVGESCCLNG